MHPARAFALLPCVAVLTACGEHVPTGGSGPDVPKPLFDHRAPEPTVAVDINNYVLQLRPDNLWNAAYKGTGALFAGELSYGNAPDAVFFYDARGTRTLPALQGTVLPVEVSAPNGIADHHTVSLLIEKTVGASRPLGLIAVRETFAFGDAPDDDYVILKYTLFNPGPENVSGLHVGQILDLDVGPDLPAIVANVVEYDADARLVRAVAPAGTPVAGHAVLREPPTSYRPATNPSNFGLTPADPATAAEGFAFLSGGIVHPEPFGPADIRHTLSRGPMTVRAGEGEVVTFVLAGGDDAADLAANVAAAETRYGRLPVAARRPYPVIQAGVTIAPWPVDPSIHTEFTATLKGIPRKLIPLLDKTKTFCGVRRVTASPASSLTTSRNAVRATFPATNLPPGGLGIGDEVVCAGRLTDGTLFVGRPDPTPLPVAPTIQLTTIGTNRAPTWSPDGSAIAFSSDRDGTFAIWRMTVASGEASAVRLTDGPDDRAPDWFGSTIAFGRGEEIQTVSDGGGPVTLLNGDGRNPRYSPDGTTLAFTRGAFHVWRMAATGGAETQLTAGGLEFHPEWSRDGTEIYFTDFGAGGGTIFKVPVGGGGASQVTPTEGTDNRHPAVSPDGRWLAFTSNGQIVLQELATGHHTVVPLAPFVLANPVTGAETNQNLEFSPDGTKLLFAAGGQIWVADLAAILQ